VDALRSEQGLAAPRIRRAQPPTVVAAASGRRHCGWAEKVRRHEQP
jgi:hypothetical protein